MGTLTSALMSLPSSIAEIGDARMSDTALNGIKNGETLSGVQPAAEAKTDPTASTASPEALAEQNAIVRQQPLEKGETTGIELNMSEKETKTAFTNQTPEFSTEKTYIDDDPETHTAEQMRRIEEYKQAVDPGMIDFIRMARKNPNNKNSYSLGAVTSKQAQRIKEITGIDVTGFVHSINTDAIRHIDRRHGVSGEANHSMAHIEDIARIRYVMENADSIDLVFDKNGKQVFSWKIRKSDNTPAPMIQYTKALDGVCYVIQAITDSKAKKLRMVSAYIRPKQSVPSDEASA